MLKPKKRKKEKDKKKASRMRLNVQNKYKFVMNKNIKKKNEKSVQYDQSITHTKLLLIAKFRKETIVHILLRKVERTIK